MYMQHESEDTTDGEAIFISNRPTESDSNDEEAIIFLIDESSSENDVCAKP